MLRISGATVDADLHGAGKDGFASGTPGTVAATVVTDDWLNGVQEEIVSAVEAAGLTPDADTDQLAAAIGLLAGSAPEFRPANVSTDQDNYTHAEWSLARVVLFSPQADVTFTGFDATAVIRRKLIYNKSGTYSLAMTNSDAASLAANRVVTEDAASPFTLGPRCWAEMYYDTVQTCWRVAPMSIDRARDIAWLGEHTFDEPPRFEGGFSAATATVDDSGEYGFSPARSVPRRVPLHTARPWTVSSSGTWSWAGAYWSIIGDGSDLMVLDVPLNGVIPMYGTIEEWSCNFSCNDGSAAAVVGALMYRTTSGTETTVSSVNIGGSVTNDDDGAAGVGLLIAPATHEYFVRFSPKAALTTGNYFRLHSLTITVDATEAMG